MMWEDKNVFFICPQSFCRSVKVRSSAHEARLAQFTLGREPVGGHLDHLANFDVLKPGLGRTPAAIRPGSAREAQAAARGVYFRDHQIKRLGPFTFEPAQTERQIPRLGDYTLTAGGQNRLEELA